MKDYLNSLEIEKLYFHTETGTDLEIVLSPYSIWSIGFNSNLHHQTDPNNFPSYEIYTSPDIRYTNGRVIMEKPSSLYGVRITSGVLEFENGNLTSVDSDNPRWNKMIKNKKNNLQQVGEIALVSQDSPIAKLGKTFAQLLLDENAGCHLALGNSLEECIRIPTQELANQGKNYYNFAESLYHQDLIFGNDTMEVECKTKYGKKKTLIKNGIWNL